MQSWNVMLSFAKREILPLLVKFVSKKEYGNWVLATRLNRSSSRTWMESRLVRGETKS
jgi:hypothetical protein